MKKIDFDANLSFNSPIGAISLYSKNNRIIHLEIGNESPSSSGKAKVLEEAQKQLKRYFAGKAAELDFEISLGGTAFQQSVWQVIDQIPFGHSLSYADIATAIGNPKAVRAVGAAVGANPVPIRIGCHRVLGSNASITGYSGGDGIPTKRWLLEHERIQTKD